MSVEYTYARKDSKDQILLVDLPAVSGFSQGQWQNAGGLQAQTRMSSRSQRRLINTPIDGAHAQHCRRPHPSEDHRLVDLPERLYGFQQMPAAFFLGPNRDLGVLYGNHWVRDVNELYDDPDKAARTGPGRRGVPTAS